MTTKVKTTKFVSFFAISCYVHWTMKRKSILHAMNVLMIIIIINAICKYSSSLSVRLAVEWSSIWPTTIRLSLKWALFGCSFLCLFFFSSFFILFSSFLLLGRSASSIFLAYHAYRICAAYFIWIYCAIETGVENLASLNWM